MRAAMLALTVALPLPVATHAAAEGTAAECAARLDRTLQVMQQRAPMKDEVATGLMWLRMDAEDALRAGDPAGCLARVATVEQVLNMATEER